MCAFERSWLTDWVFSGRKIDNRQNGERLTGYVGVINECPANLCDFLLVDYRCGGDLLFFRRIVSTVYNGEDPIE